MINLVNQLYCLKINERREFIIDYLKERNIHYVLQKFESPFGFGYNIIVEKTKIKDSNLIITAHYDGNGIFDNIGGIVALIQLIELFNTNIPAYSIKFIFTDLEEKFQQGSKYFFKKYYLTISQDSHNIKGHVNIDGFGIGDSIVASAIGLNRLYNSEDNVYSYLLLDNDVFSNLEIPSVHIFSCFHKDAISIIDQHNFGDNFIKYLTEDWCRSHFSQNFESLVFLIYSFILDFNFNNKIIIKKLNKAG